MNSTIAASLLLLCLSFAYATRGSAQDESAEQLTVDEGEEDSEELLGDFAIDYSLENTIGLGTFQPHERSITHGLDLAVGYAPTEYERLNAGFGIWAELFSRSRCVACLDNGAGNGVFVNDLWIDFTTTRMTTTSERVTWSLTPNVRFSFPTSQRSRKVEAYYVDTLARFGGSMRYRDFTLSLTPELGATFYRHNHVVFEDAELPAQDGSLNAPLALRVAVGISYRFLEHGTIGASYRMGKSMTYRSNGGERYWHDTAVFRARASYEVRPWLTFALAYLYVNDPVNGFGDIRNPFFNRYADYSNTSAVTLSVEGTIE